MDDLDALAIIAVLIFIGAPLLIIAFQISRSRSLTSRWEMLGWSTALVKQPVRFADIHRMKRFVTRSFQRDEIDGAITVGSKGNYSDSGSTTSTRTALFVANPFHGPSVQEFVNTNNPDGENAAAEGVDFGDTSALETQSWESLRPFIEENPPPHLYNLQISRYWLFFLTWMNDPGPAEALALLDYLGDVSLAVQGKPTSSVDHKAALANARKVDAIKWRKKDEYAAAAEKLRART